MMLQSSVQCDRYIHDGMPEHSLLPEFVFQDANAFLPRELNVVDHLFTSAISQGHADRPFLRSDAVTFTYAQVLERVNRIARVLVDDHQLVPGNRVLLRGGNSIGMALAWLATVKAGLIAVPTMPLLRARELKAILEKARPQLCICDAKLMQELKNAVGAEALPLLQFGLGNHAQDLGVLAASKSAEFSAAPTLAVELAMMAFTSGTTGAPKAAVHTHRDLLAACQAWPLHVLKPVPTDIVVGTPPLAFTFGLGGLLLFPLWACASVYFPATPFTPQSLVEAIVGVGATTCYTAPTFYRQMAQHLRPGLCPSLRDCVSAGEALPIATRQSFKKASGLDLLDGIGATEMFHIFISSRSPDTVPGALGKVVPGYEAKIVNERGETLPCRTIGRLAVRGPTGCKYFDDVRQATYVIDGWNFPGDAFYQDEQGNFFYQSRTDDMIITAGYNVGASDVEDVLLTHDAVGECAVIGEPDPERGMLVHAFIVLKREYLPGDDMVLALQEHVKAVAAPYKYPRKISFVSELPRTETGKLQRFRLRQASK
jgi:2-aminobenzoate-CoA ligase